MRTRKPQKDPKKIANYLAQGRAGKLAAQAKRLLVIQDLVRTALPHPLSQHCYVLHYQERCLTVATDSASWIHLLHAQTNKLITLLQRHALIKGINKVSYKVHPPATEQPKPPKEKLAMSENSKKIVRNMAKHISDPTLKASLKKLGQPHNPA